MRKATTIWLAFTLVTLVLAALPVNVSAVGEVSLWKFDEGVGATAYDSWGANDGTIFGATWTTGIMGSALDFDGLDDFVEIPDDPSLDITDEITIKAWIKPEQTNMGYVVVKEDVPGYPQFGAVFSLDIFPGKVRAVFWQEGSPPPITPTVVGSTNIAPDVWQHIAVTWDGSIAKVFYNGVLDGVANFTGPIKLSDANVAIGRYGSVFFDGAIDNVEIYNIALTDEEIEENYYLGISPVHEIEVGPGTLNLNSNGKWITCYIELKPGYDVGDIDVSTVAITKIGGNPVYIPAASHPTGIGDEDGDGIPDLMIKFDRSEVQDACSPGMIEIIISGSLIDGTVLLGSGIITVIEPP